MNYELSPSCPLPVDTSNNHTGREEDAYLGAVLSSTVSQILSERWRSRDSLVRAHLTISKRSISTPLTFAAGDLNRTFPVSFVCHLIIPHARLSLRNVWKGTLPKAPRILSHHTLPEHMHAVTAKNIFSYHARPFLKISDSRSRHRFRSGHIHHPV